MVTLRTPFGIVRCSLARNRRLSKSVPLPDACNQASAQHVVLRHRGTLDFRDLPVGFNVHTGLLYTTSQSRRSNHVSFTNYWTQKAYLSVVGLTRGDAYSSFAIQITHPSRVANMAIISSFPGLGIQGAVMQRQSNRGRRLAHHPTRRL